MRIRTVALLALAACNGGSASAPSSAAMAGSAASTSASSDSAAPGSAAPGSAAPSPSIPPVPLPAAAAAGLDLATAFAPGPGDLSALEGLRVPIKRASALIRAAGFDEQARVNEFQVAVGYDVDRDGKVDLVQIPQARAMQRVDWLIAVPEGGKLRELFTVTGNWDDIRVGRGTATLRFRATMTLGEEPRISWTLHRANGAWAPPIKSYMAVQTKIPRLQLPFRSFEARARATLRAAPAVDDSREPAPAAPNDQARPGWPDEPTAMLRGNAFATYAAGARGLVLASEGAWRYVALEPAARRLELPFEPVGAQDASPDGAWFCGWVAANELIEQR
jgi:hypothetical protein